MERGRRKGEGEWCIRAWVVPGRREGGVKGKKGKKVSRGEKAISEGRGESRGGKQKGGKSAVVRVEGGRKGRKRGRRKGE